MPARRNRSVMCVIAVAWLLSGCASAGIAADSNSLVCDYPGQTPGKAPQIFGKGTVSVDGRNTHAVRFSPDGRMLIFSRYPDGTSYQMVRTKDGWSEPVKTSFTGKEVAFDASGKRLFYYDKGDIFCIRCGENGFSEPNKLGGNINTKETEYYPCMTARGTLYFSRNGKWDKGRIMAAAPEGDGFSRPVELPECINKGGASHGFVAPDEGYLLFNSPREGSHTGNDIWVSFRKEDGGWGEPANLGKSINCDAMAVLCPTVSPDGKYLFFTRLQEDGKAGYVWWVSTEVIHELRARR
jgi:hypothetical protein